MKTSKALLKALATAEAAISRLSSHPKG